MTDELELIDSQIADDVFYIDSKRLTIYDYLDGIDTVLSQVREGDFETGINTLRSMSSIGHAIGISKAKLLHGMHEIWIGEHKNSCEEQFFEYITEFGLLKNRTIIERYINAWNAYLQAPAVFCERLLLQPMKNLNALGAAVSQGYEPTDGEWEDMSNAGSNGEFLNTIRKVKGKEPRKNSLTLYIDDGGNITAWQDSKFCIVGYLDLSVDTDPCPDMKVKAIERIIKSAGIQHH